MRKKLLNIFIFTNLETQIPIGRLKKRGRNFPKKQA
jgi:hypothetical protein